MNPRPLFLASAWALAAMSLVPGAASGALSLRIGPNQGMNTEDVRFEPAFPPDPGPEFPAGTQFLDLIFTESPDAEDEGLSTYDINVRVVRPGGSPGGIRLVPITTSAQRRALTQSNNFVFGPDVTVTVPEGGSTEDSLFVNFDNTGDALANITTGMTAGRIPYTVDGTALLGDYFFEFIPETTTFATGLEGVPPRIAVNLDDRGVIMVPEPSGLVVLALCGVAVLSRRRSLGSGRKRA